MLGLQAIDLVINKENIPLAPDPQSKRPTPQLNRVPSKTKRGMWTNKALETVMDVVDKRTHSLKKDIISWNILVISIANHLNGKTKSRKMGPKGVLTKKEDAIVIKWTLNMQECGLSISLQQLKMKVVGLTQTKDTSF
jgi:hypothetical protein